LQVALDIENLDRALKIAEESVEGGIDWIEAGTLLIKSEGMRAIRELKKLYPSKTIVADMKTVDTGKFEVEVASKSGADVVIILGVSDDSTIKEAIRAGHKYGAKIMADLITVSDKIKRARELEELGLDYICIHVGIDQQMDGKSPLEYVRTIKDKVNMPIAAAGGINSETAVSIHEAGAEIIIVGGAITKAKDCKSATEVIRKSISQKKAIRTELFKKYSDQELYEVFQKVSTANLADAMHRKNTMKNIHPITKVHKMAGKAITVNTMLGDWAKTVEAIDIADSESVIVINAGGGELAVWGELATNSCLQKKVRGVVIDGGVRDVLDIRGLNFPIYAKFITPEAGEPKGHGEINTRIICGGVNVVPGDYIVGDDDGVIVVPKKRAKEIANRALDVLERENRIREEIQRGSTLSAILELNKWEKIG